MRDEFYLSEGVNNNSAKMWSTPGMGLYTQGLGLNTPGMGLYTPGLGLNTPGLGPTP